MAGEPIHASGCLLMKRMKESEMVIDLLFMQVKSKHLIFKEINSRHSKWEINSPYQFCTLLTELM